MHLLDKYAGGQECMTQVAEVYKNGDPEASCMPDLGFLPLYPLLHNKDLNSPLLWLFG